MSSNKVINSKNLGSLLKGGKQIAVAVATETDKWTRPESAATSNGPNFRKAIENDPKPLPQGTAKVIMRESEHPSDNDPRNHYTAVCQDESGNHITTIHVEKKD